MGSEKEINIMDEEESVGLRGIIYQLTCWRKADALHGKNESLSYSHQTTSGQILPFNCRVIHCILI